MTSPSPPSYVRRGQRKPQRPRKDRILFYGVSELRIPLAVAGVEVANRIDALSVRRRIDSTVHRDRKMRSRNLLLKPQNRLAELRIVCWSQRHIRKWTVQIGRLADAAQEEADQQHIVAAIRA